VEPIDVVVGADVIVAALSRISAHAVVFPAMPPKTPDPHADVIGTFVSGLGDFAWILSDEIIEQTSLALTDDTVGLGWDLDEADGAIDTICNIADLSSGGLVVADATVQLPNVGEAARAAMRTAASKDLGQPRVAVVVTDDAYALARSEWGPQGIPWPAAQTISIMGPDRFRNLVERARWGLRRL
jgi:hypothetical protein